MKNEPIKLDGEIFIIPIRVGAYIDSLMGKVEKLRAENERFRKKIIELFDEHCPNDEFIDCYMALERLGDYLSWKKIQKALEG